MQSGLKMPTVSGMPASVPPALSDIEIQRALGSLPGWSRKGEAIAKSYQFATFLAGIAFVNQVAGVAEELQHHPDIDIRYTRVMLSLSTHDSNGVTAKDIELAQRVEKIAIT